MAHVVSYRESPTSMRTFSIIWFGQLVSVLGSQITNFALGLWVLQRTGAVTPFALTFLATLLPALFLAPIAGSLVDRWNRRTVMLLSDFGSALGTLLIWGLIAFGSLDLWVIYLVAALKSTLGVFQSPAYASVVPQLVPGSQLGRANGMIQGAEAIALLLSPILAGMLLPLINLGGIVLLDLATFMVAVLTLMWVRAPQVRPESGDTQPEPITVSIVGGWRYILAHPGILGLIIFFGFSNFLAGVVQVLVIPLILSFVSVSTMGLLLTLGSCGMLFGSVLISAWGGPRRMAWAVLGFHLLAVWALILMGLAQSALVVATGLFLIYFCVPIINSVDRSIINRKVAPQMQGRVFALSNMLAASAMPIGYVLAGPLADLVFKPLLLSDGALSSTLGPLLGVGEARGIGLLFVVLGLLGIAVTLGGALYRPLRRIDDLPDVGLSSETLPMSAATPPSQPNQQLPTNRPESATPPHDLPATERDVRNEHSGISSA